MMVEFASGSLENLIAKVSGTTPASLSGSSDICNLTIYLGVSLEDIIVSKDELLDLFETEKIIDTGKGWYMDNSFVNIIALHEIEPNFLQNITNAKFYKIVKK